MKFYLLRCTYFTETIEKKIIGYFSNIDGGFVDRIAACLQQKKVVSKK